MSPGSSCSFTSGTPSSDHRFPDFMVDKTGSGSYYGCSEDDDSSLDRPIRTNSVGSKPDQYRSRKNRWASVGVRFKGVDVCSSSSGSWLSKGTGACVSVFALLVLAFFNFSCDAPGLWCGLMRISALGFELLRNVWKSCCCLMLCLLNLLLLTV